MEASTQERQRLVALRRHKILDTPREETFDRITSLLARLLGVPFACVSLVDDVRVWFKSAHGLDSIEVPREPGLCSSTVEGDLVRYIEDTAIHPETLEHSLVGTEGGIRFYVGAPLTTVDGHRIGTLCAFGPEPHKLTAEQIELVPMLAGLVMHEIVFRRERGAIDPLVQGAVLVIDDDELILALVRRALERTGFQPFTAATIEEARVHLAEHGGDLRAAILDVGMPEPEFEAIRAALRQSSPHVRIVLSGMSHERDVGAERYLQKPFGPDQLLEVVRAAVRT